MDQEYVCSITPTEFEKYCLEILAGFAEEEQLCNFEITHNVKIPVEDGTYQIDVYAVFTAMGVEFKMLCECKQYLSPVGRDKVEVLSIRGHIQTVEPGFLDGACPVKEQDIGGNGGIGCKNTTRHTNDCLQVEFRQQLLLDVHLSIVCTKQETVGQDHRYTDIFLQAVHNDRHKQVSSLRAGKVIGEMILDLCLLAAAIGRVHKDYIEAVIVGIVQHIFQQRVVMVHPGNVQPMEQQIGDAEHVGKLLLFNAIDGIAILFCIGSITHLLLQFLQPAGDKATGAAGKVGHGLANLWLYHLGHEVRYRTRSIEFTGRTSTLKLF